MPNHVSQVLTVTGPGASVRGFIARHIVPLDGEPGKVHFDFGTVIRRPEIVTKTESGTEAEAGFYALTGLHEAHFAWSKSPMQIAAEHHGFPMTPVTTWRDYAVWLAERNPGAIEKGRLSLQCFRETGHRSWYDWNIANWGTKWGAYDYAERSREPGRFVFYYETAWSVPEPILQSLAALHADLTFDLIAIDEGGPEYVGHWTNRSEYFEKVEPSADRYRVVYGREPDADEEDEEVVASEGAS